MPAKGIYPIHSPKRQRIDSAACKERVVIVFRANGILGRRVQLLNWSAQGKGSGRR